MPVDRRQSIELRSEPAKLPWCHVENLTPPPRQRPGCRSSSRWALAATLAQGAATGTRFTSDAVSDTYSGSQTETNDDAGEDVSQSPADRNMTQALGGTDNEHDTDTDVFQAEISGTTTQMDVNDETLTDSTTGVVTTTDADGYVFDDFKDAEHDNTTDRHNNSGDDITGGETTTTSDLLKNFSELNVTLAGSPVAGLVENVNNYLSVKGTTNAWNENSDELHDVVGYVSNVPGGSASSSSSETDTNTDVAFTGSDSAQTITNSETSTTTSIDPATGLQTVDTLAGGGRIVVADDQHDLETDVYTLGEPNDPAGEGEDDISNNPRDQEAIDGKENSTETLVVSGTTPDGTTVSSTEVLGSQVTASDDTDDNQQITAVDLQSGGQQKSETAQTIDRSDNQVTAQDRSTDLVQSTISTIDPTTGLQVTFAVQDSSGDTTSNTDHGDALDVGTFATGSITQGIAPAVTTTATDSGEIYSTGHDTSFDRGKVIIITLGSDGQGGQISLQETTTLTDLGSDDLTDDDIQAAGGTNSDNVQDHGTGSVQLTDFLYGSIVTIDPTSGVKTIRTFNDLIASDAGDSADLAQNLDTGTGNVGWNQDETTTQTNPDGSTANPTTASTNQGSDTETWVNGVTTDQGNAVVPASSGAGGTAPAITGVTTAGGVSGQGSTNGGDTVVITGAGFTSNSQVNFDGTAAVSRGNKGPPMMQILFSENSAVLPRLSNRRTKSKRPWV